MFFITWACARQPGLGAAGRAEAAGAALRGVEVFDGADGGHGDALEDELGDAVALADWGSVAHRKLPNSLLNSSSLWLKRTTLTSPR